MRHIYTGDGKGKTTAAIGLAIRAAGAGRQVVFAQLMKGQRSSELRILETIPQIQVFHLDRSFGFSWQWTAQEKQEIVACHNEMVKKILQVAAALAKTECAEPLIILDEAISAWNKEAVDKELLRRVWNLPCAEVVFTGREPAEELTASADYLTNMSKEKHPYDAGIGAREGIEW